MSNLSKAVIPLTCFMRQYTVSFQEQNLSLAVCSAFCPLLRAGCSCRAVKAVLNRVRSEGAEVMIASHNQYSVETAVAEMYELDIDPRSQPVFFGQLLGAPLAGLPSRLQNSFKLYSEDLPPGLNGQHRYLPTGDLCYLSPPC